MRSFTEFIPSLHSGQALNSVKGYCISITHYSEQKFLNAFRTDLAHSIDHIIILSPFLSQNRAIHYYPILHSLTARQVIIDVYARPRQEQPENLRAQYGAVEHSLKRAGVRFYIRPGMHEKVGISEGYIMTLPFAVESKVRCRKQVWEVLKVTDNQDGSWTVRLFPENGGKPQSFLYPHTPIEPLRSALDHLEEGRIDHIDYYRLLTNATRLSLVYEYDKLLSISNSKMIPEPYQLLAVKKVMESLRQRFLIADDVGLGKTIEAGLIMQELTARQRGKRVLIIVPCLATRSVEKGDAATLLPNILYLQQSKDGRDSGTR